MRGLKKVRGLILAEKILRELNALIREKVEEGADWTHDKHGYPDIGYVKSYSNGREQGYCVEYRERRISFSESRGSDEVVVYVGNGELFDQGNVPSERAYEDANYFSSRKLRVVAEFILSRLVEWHDKKEIEDLERQKQARKVA